MNLYLKQKVFSIGDKYTIYDKNENIVYKCKGKFFTIMPKFHIYDLEENELFHIQGKFSFIGKYELYKNGELFGTLNRIFKFFKPEFKLSLTNGDNIKIVGGLLGRAFQFFKNGVEIGGVSKKLISWGDSYEISIQNPEDAILICTLVITIDNACHKR